MRESEIIKVISFIHISNIWDLRPVFFIFFLLPTPSPSSSAIIGKGWGGMRWHHLLDLRLCFPFGSPYSHLEAPNHWWLLHPYLLICQEILYFTTGSLRWLEKLLSTRRVSLGTLRSLSFLLSALSSALSSNKRTGCRIASGYSNACPALSSSAWPFPGLRPQTTTIQFSSAVSNSLQSYELQHTRLPVFHHLPELAQTHVHWVSDVIQPSHPLLSPSPPAFNLSQHQGLFKWVSPSQQLAKVLEFKLQHQSFQLFSGLISFRIDWFDLLAVQGTLKSLLQHHSSKASILQRLAFFMVQLSHPYMTIGKTMAQMVQCLPAMRETQVWSRGREDPLEKEMVTHSSTLAWKIPQMEEPGRLQSMGSQSRTRLSNFTFLSFD